MEIDEPLAIPACHSLVPVPDTTTLALAVPAAAGPSARPDAEHLGLAHVAGTLLPAVERAADILDEQCPVDASALAISRGRKSDAESLFYGMHMCFRCAKTFWTHGAPGRSAKSFSPSSLTLVRRG